MPTPNKGESHDDWMARCMGDEEQNKTFPDQAQRGAVCESKWTQHEKDMSASAKLATINMRGNDVAEVLVYDQIGVDPFFGDGISAKDFREQIKGIKAKTINLRINSPGGSVTEAFAMMQALDEFPGRIEVDIDGIAASAGAFMAMAGDHIRIPANAMMMIHEPHVGMTGATAGKLRQTAELLDKVNKQQIEAFMRRAKVDRKKLAQMLADETWMMGEEAVGYGLADEVTGHVAIAAHYDLRKFGYKHPPQMIQVTAELQKQKDRFERLASETNSGLIQSKDLLKMFKHFPSIPKAEVMPMPSTNPFGPIQVGDMVQWLTEDPEEMSAEMECGCVEEIATSGTVGIPGTSLTLEGSADNPACRVADDDGDCWYLVPMSSLQKAAMPMTEMGMPSQ